MTTTEIKMVPRTAAQAYARIGIETGTHAANPARLVVMLYDGALQAIADAGRHVAGQRVADKGKAISKAITIIDTGLRASLDLESGPLAVQLDQIYEYLSRRLLLAGVHNDTQGLQEVSRLLAELRGAWEELAEAGASHPSPRAGATTAAVPV